DLDEIGLLIGEQLDPVIYCGEWSAQLMAQTRAEQRRYAGITDPARDIAPQHRHHRRLIAAASEDRWKMVHIPDPSAGLSCGRAALFIALGVSVERPAAPPNSPAAEPDKNVQSRAARSRAAAASKSSGRLALKKGSTGSSANGTVTSLWRAVHK